MQITNEDNMDLMARYPDKYFDLAIVDPPYGIHSKISVGGGKHTKSTVNFHNKYNEKKWDKEIPNDEYFNELFRVSKNQIVWGANYYRLPPTRGIICWDKMKQVPNFSQWEMAWTSFDKVALIFKYMWHGNYCGFDKNITLKHTSINLIHPTQKPVPLYKWLLDNYAKEGDKILDTHLGSGSIAIACHDLGFDLTACELDTDYYNAAMKRIADHKKQIKLF